MPADIHDPFHRALAALVEGKYNERMVGLASGNARPIVGSRQTLGENYAEQIGYLAALRDVLDWAGSVENDLLGTTKPEPGGQ